MSVLVEVRERIEDVRIDLITKDPEFQMRKKLDGGAIKRYAEVIKAGTRLPPITLALADGMHLLVDGWHRIEALKLLGRPNVRAEIVEVSRADALWMAAKANLEHGVPLKASELRNVFRAYVKAGRHRKRRNVYRSYREIGDDLGKPHTTVRNWMLKDFPKIAAKMGGNDNFGEGGLQPVEASSPDCADRLVEELGETFRASSDPDYRGHIIAEIGLALEVMKASGGWTERPAADF